MAALDSSQVTPIWSDGQCEKTQLFAFKGVSASDTFDLSPYFRVAKRAAMVGITIAGSATVTVTNNVLTIPATVASDAIYVLVFGVTL